MCGALTGGRAAYLPHDDGRIVAEPLTFPLCEACGIELQLGTPAGRALLEDLRALALEPGGAA